MIKWILLGIGVIINLVSSNILYKIIGLGIVYWVAYMYWGRKKTFRKMSRQEIYR